MYNIPTGPSDYPSAGNEPGANNEIKGGRPGPYMQPPPSPWTNQNQNQRAPLDANVAYVEGWDEAERGASNQPLTQDFFMSSGKRKRDEIASQYNAGGYIPQQDGAGDEGECLTMEKGNVVNPVPDTLRHFPEFVKDGLATIEDDPVENH
ncbi:hypothetical protein JHK87_016216 [Glycine soja]|nr:hypothetical protein JHK87_016216 [Glycine soja]